MRKIWIVRHAERIDFQDPNWATPDDDRYDPYLSPQGWQQARDLGDRLAHENVHMIFASPFRRCLETATAVADRLDLPIRIERGLGEMLSPDWFAQDPRVWLEQDRIAMFPRIIPGYRSMVDPAFGEDWELVKIRAAETARKLVEMFDGNLLLIGHGATVSSTAWGLVEGHPTMQGGCCRLVELTQDDNGSWQVTLNGDDSYLSYVEPAVRLH